MDRTNLFCAGVMLLICSSAVSAGLSAEFDGYTAVWEVGVSGLQSSYSADSMSGITLPNYMLSLGPEHVTYPHGVGQVASPGGAVGQVFDEGAMGVKVQGGNLMIRVAGGLNPLEGYYYSGWKTWYGQGDVFITVEDTAGIGHFALLNSWPRDGGDYVQLNGGHFDDARQFHTGEVSGTNLEGHLVSLFSTDHVVRAGGAGSYHPGYSSNGLPQGLDYRVYAQGGADKGDAGLAHSQLTDLGQQWYIQTWTFPTNWLSSDPVFSVGLHKAASCANDQIGVVTVVPAPGALVLGLAGFGTIGFIRKTARKAPKNPAKSIT